MNLSAEQLKKFEDDGYIFLPKVFSKEEESSAKNSAFERFVASLVPPCIIPLMVSYMFEQTSLCFLLV